jgi:hypothetical protein
LSIQHSAFSIQPSDRTRNPDGRSVIADLTLRG